jgi:hypothetical protein
MSFSNLREGVLYKVFRSKLHTDVLFLLALTLAAGFNFWDRARFFSEYLSWATTIFAVIMWVWLALASGFMRRGWFVVFTLVYWLLPQTAIIAHTNTEGYSVVLHTLARFSDIFVRASLGNISQALDLNGFLTGIALLLLCEFMFFMGSIYRRACENSGWYRDFHERYDI